jgi:hypothetical protein
MNFEAEHARQKSRCSPVRSFGCAGATSRAWCRTPVDQNFCAVGRGPISSISTSAGSSFAKAMARATEAAGMAIL